VEAVAAQVGRPTVHQVLTQDQQQQTHRQLWVKKVKTTRVTVVVVEQAAEEPLVVNQETVDQVTTEAQEASQEQTQHQQVEQNLMDLELRQVEHQRHFINPVLRLGERPLVVTEQTDLQ
tara:strand:- start:4 stop:360 length:357 start_codon:yes stop_codon:yes gene_type:complete